MGVVERPERGRLSVDDVSVVFGCVGGTDNCVLTTAPPADVTPAGIDEEGEGEETC